MEKIFECDIIQIYEILSGMEKTKKRINVDYLLHHKN